MLGFFLRPAPHAQIEPREIAIALQRLFSRLQCDDVESTDTEELTAAFGVRLRCTARCHATAELLSGGELHIFLAFSASQWTGQQASEQQDLQELKNVCVRTTAAGHLSHLVRCPPTPRLRDGG